MFAVIDIKGHQFRVAEGDTIVVPKFAEDAGASIALDRVLMIGGEQVAVGTPVVEGASVAATVVEHGRHPKIDGFKYKRRKGYRRSWGHKQQYTLLKIDQIMN